MVSAATEKFKNGRLLGSPTASCSRSREKRGTCHSVHSIGTSQSSTVRNACDRSYSTPHICLPTASRAACNCISGITSLHMRITRRSSGRLEAVD